MEVSLLISVLSPSLTVSTFGWLDGKRITEHSLLHCLWPSRLKTVRLPTIRLPTTSMTASDNAHASRAFLGYERVHTGVTAWVRATEPGARDRIPARAAFMDGVSVVGFDSLLATAAWRITGRCCPLLVRVGAVYAGPRASVARMLLSVVERMSAVNTILVQILRAFLVVMARDRTRRTL